MEIVILTSIRLFGDGLASYFNTRQNMSVVAVANSFSILLSVMNHSKIDLALIDVTQGINLEEVKALASQWPSTALIAIGIEDHHQDIIRCGRAGFSGFVLRDASLCQLLNTIEDAVVGRLNCSPEVSGELLKALHRTTNLPNSSEYTEALTPRECEVLWEIGNGLSNKEIARKLGLSISTVKHHVHKVLEKLQVARRAEAMRQVRKMPWLAGASAMLREIKSPMEL
jgi:two-component system nitrate/nitrite response regulator NarL